MMTKKSMENTKGRDVVQEVTERSFGKKAFEAAFHRPDTRVRVLAAFGLWTVLFLRIEEIADMMIVQWLGLTQELNLAQTLRFWIVDIGRYALVAAAVLCLWLLYRKIKSARAKTEV